MPLTALPNDNPEMTAPGLDATLIASIRDGDAIAARQFYDSYADRVHRTASRVLRDQAAAEEVTQDVFVRAFAFIEQVRDPSAIGAWLSAITVRMAYDALRAQRRRANRFLSLDHAGDTAAPAQAEPLIGDHVRQAIGRLSRKLQLVLVMYELEGHSHAEIAEALQIPIATSKTRLSQARATLRRELAAYAPSEATYDR